MTREEQMQQIQVETEWNTYSSIFASSYEVRKSYNKLILYIEDAIKKGYTWIKDFIIDKAQYYIKNRIKRISEIINEKFNDIHRTAKWFYLMYYYDTEGRFVYSKIGTTERTLYVRAHEHCINDKGSYSDIGKVKIIKGWDFQNINPRHFEIDITEYFANLYPEAYVPHDRFNIVLDVNIIEEKIKEWMPIYSMIKRG